MMMAQRRERLGYAYFREGGHILMDQKLLAFHGTDLVVEMEVYMISYKGGDATSFGVVPFGSTTGGAYYWQWRVDGSEYFVASSSGLPSATPLPKATWKKVRMEATATERKVYMDGVLVASKNEAYSGIPQAARRWTLGKYEGNASLDMTGYMRNVKLYAGGNLVGFYKLNGDARDSSGNENHGVEQGNVTYVITN